MFGRYSLPPPAAGPSPVRSLPADCGPPTLRPTRSHAEPTGLHAPHPAAIHPGQESPAAVPRVAPASAANLPGAALGVLRSGRADRSQSVGPPSVLAALTLHGSAGYCAAAGNAALLPVRSHPTRIRRVAAPIPLLPPDVLADGSVDTLDCDNDSLAGSSA